MKKILPGLMCLAVVLIFYHCNDNYGYFDDEDSGPVSDQFSVAEAQAYFERTATDLRTVDLTPEASGPATKSMALLPDARQGQVLAPLWKRARQTDDNGRTVSIEVPLDMQGRFRQTVVAEKRGGKQKIYPTFSFSRLIVKKVVETGETFHFIATFIPDSACYAKRKDNMNNYRYMKDRDYSGLVILSDESGKFLNAFLRKEGRQRCVTVRKGGAKTGNDPKGEDNVLMQFNWSEAPSAFSMRANDSEEENPIPGFCLGCFGSLDESYNCTNPNCSGFVVEAPKPDKPAPTPTCTNPGCPYGGLCNGLCGLGSGGSESGDGWGESGGEDVGGGGGAWSPPNGMHVDLKPLPKFVGYDVVKDCLKSARATMDKMGFRGQYGGSDHIYQLMWEKGNTLTRYGPDFDQTFTSAMQCINRHLKNGRPIIVGVNHSFLYEESYNEGTTDHFILITGKGYDAIKKQYYYTYVETARWQANAQAACDVGTNKLYYDSQLKTLSNPKAYGGNNKPLVLYTVTQVRPNDGNIEGTITQPDNPHRPKY